MTDKAIILDFDGTLADTSLMHHHGVVYAIGGDNSIDQYHENMIGMSTPAKLTFLEGKGYTFENKDDIIKKKWEHTFDEMHNFIKFDKELIDLILALKSKGYRFSVASNGYSDYVTKGVNILGLEDLDAIETVSTHPAKPDPSMIYACLKASNCDANDAIMIDDCNKGLESAKTAGVVTLIKVSNLEDTKNYLRTLI